MTHTVTHTTKRVDGNSGEDRAYLPQYTELKASKSLKKQQAECPDTLRKNQVCDPKSEYANVAQSVEQLIRNQQVVCSSHIASSKKACNLQDYRLFSLLRDLFPCLRRPHTPL